MALPTYKGLFHYSKAKQLYTEVQETEKESDKGFLSLRNCRDYTQN